MPGLAPVIAGACIGDEAGSVHGLTGHKPFRYDAAFSIRRSGRHMNIRAAHPADHDAIIEVWEASVRASHHFLPEADIEALKPRIAGEYLPALRVHVCLDSSQAIKGFVATSADKIEMLFIAPEAMGSGMGRALLRHAISSGYRLVDVNEQNDRALGFYKRMGFDVVDRSPVDGQGRPFPILHMRLKD
jgi:putative acetyltransferase